MASFQLIGKPISRRAAVAATLLAALNHSGAWAEPVALQAYRAVQFQGSCDASGAVPLSDSLFAVADDEDNVIRVYDADTGGAPLLQYDLSYNPKLKPERDQYNRAPPAPLDEMDIEAATVRNGLAYWLTSHGRDSKGRPAPDRLRFFATRIDLPDQRVSLAAPAVTDLLTALFRSPQFKPFELEQAEAKPPKAEGGLSIEGMTAVPGGGLLLGFRNPVPAGRAILVELENPEAALEGQQPRFGSPLTVDLGGRGVRGISYWKGHYMLAAGHYGEGFDPALFLWRGPGHTPTQVDLELPERFNAEAFFTPDGRGEFMLLSDDGGLDMGGKACKKLKNANDKYFRGLWVRPPAATAERAAGVSTTEIARTQIEAAIDQQEAAVPPTAAPPTISDTQEVTHIQED